MKELVIDVSHWDGNVDYEAWKKKHNLWGVIIKAGGNETSLGRYKDSQFENNYKKAKAAGLHIGAYYYTVSTSTTESKKDAEHFISLLKDHTFDLPVYMDVEDPRQFALSKTDLTTVITTFCDTLVSKKYYAGLYTGGYAWLNNMHYTQLLKYANWIAWWRAAWPTEAGDIGLWQQGTMRLSDGKVYYDDISGCTDISWCVVDYPARIKNNETSSTKKEETIKIIAANVKLTKFCELMYKACAVWSLGYDQYQRQNIYDGGECDCSSLVIWALKTAGFDTGSASYTGNMSSNLTARGWKRLAPDLSKAQPGDILLNDGYHTAVVISGSGWNAKIAQASIDERGRITGGTAGDQTGNETNVRNIYTYSHGWSCILRYTEGTTSGISGKEPISDYKPTIKLEVDGIAGPATIKAWQISLKTTADGVISGQLQGNQKYFSGIHSVTWERTGSSLVRAIQKKVGVTVDGYWGYETSKGIQKFLIKNGFNVGSAGADGYFGPSSVKGLQNSLNSSKNPWK